MKRIIRKKIFILTAILLLICTVGAGTPCIAAAAGDTDAANVLTDTSDATSDILSFEQLAELYSGKTIGVQTGSVHDTYVNENIPGARVEYYNSSTELALALESGKISAYVADEPVARLLCRSYDGQYITGVFVNCPFAFAYPKGTEKTSVIRAQMNEFLAKIKADGTLKEIDDIWFGDDESLKVVDTSDLTGENGTLKFAIISAVGAPFVYVKDNAYAGYEVDIAVRFCREYGYGIEIVNLSISGMFSSIAGNLVDFAAACINVTDERKEEMDFSDADYEGSVVLVTGKSDGGEGSSDGKTGIIAFVKSLGDSFEKTFIREDRWKLFAGGLGITVLLTLLSAIFGSALGFAMFLLYRKGKRRVNRLIDCISEFLQMTPVVVILMIFYYLLFARAGFSGVTVSVIAFSLMFACSVNTLLDTAVKSVDPGQTLAVRALGYRDTKGFIRMILPQAIPYFTSGYKGALVSLIKSTSIVSYVAVQDLTMVSDIIRSRTYEAFFPLIVTAAIYFLMSFLLVKLIGKIEIKADPCNRKEKNILKGVKR